jgi:hypothetical protein
MIIEIIDMIEKADKDKYWVLEQVEKSHLNLKANPTKSTVEILDLCPISFLSKLKELLQNLGKSDQKLPKYTNTYHWFFTDIVAGANPDIATDGQTRKIITLNDLVRKTRTFKTKDPESTVILPTGDGYAIGFKDSSEKPLLLAIELHKVLNEYNISKSSKDRVDIRIGLHTGPVFPIIDLNDNENKWGPGIIYARRIMDLGRSKSILASDTFANDVKRLRPEFKKIMHLIGNYPIKHGEKISLYNVFGNVYGTEVGTKKKPFARRVDEITSESENRESANMFIFAKLEVVLNVTDPNTMMTHHTITQHMINQSDEPVQRCFYRLDGDVPRDFPDLNIKVTDDKGQELQIQNLKVNKPEHKEFFVQLNRPFMPNQKGRFVRLEYDWEERDRKYFRSFASVCKTFRFLLVAPKSLPINHKVVKVDPHTGHDVVAAIPANVRYLKDRTEVEWVSHGLEQFETYRFDW